MAKSLDMGGGGEGRAAKAGQTGEAEWKRAAQPATREHREEGEEEEEAEEEAEADSRVFALFHFFVGEAALLRFFFSRFCKAAARQHQRQQQGTPSRAEQSSPAPV